jgi:hypothetical protein
MPERGKISRLPESLRQWLEEELVRRGFADYREVTDALQSKINELHLDITVSFPTVFRFGQLTEARVAKLKQSFEMARVIRQAVPDEDGAALEALQRICQEKLLEVLLAMPSSSPDDPEAHPIDPKLLATITRAVADSARATVTQQKWQAEARARAAKVADSVAEMTKKAGASAETVEKIKREILGIA